MPDPVTIEPDRVRGATDSPEAAPCGPSSLALLPLLVALALAPRLWNLTEQCLTIDEVIEFEDSQLGLADILWSPDGFPPLYRLCLAAWRMVDPSGTGTRWPSVVFGIATIPVLWALGNRVRGSRAANWIAFLAALNPLLIYYSQEARVYSLFLLTSSWVLYSYGRMMDTESKWDWFQLALATVACGYTHYFAGLLAAALGVAWLASGPHSAASWRNAAGAVLGVGLASIPLFFLFVHDFVDTMNYGVDSPVSAAAVGYTLFTFVAGFDLGPGLAELHEMRPREALWQFLPWIAALGLPTAAACVIGVRAIATRRRWLSMLLAAIVIPIGLSVLLSATLGVRYHVRYVVCSTPALIVILGVGCAQVTSSWQPRFLIGLGLMMLAGFTTWIRHTSPLHRNEDMRGVARVLRASSNAAVPTFVLSDYMIRPLRNELDDRWNLIPFPDPNRYGRRIGGDEELTAAISLLRDSLDRHGEIWVVVSRAFHGDPDHRFRSWLAAESDPAQELAGARVYRLQSARWLQK